MGRDAPGDAAAGGVHRGGRGGHGAGVLRPPAADRGAGPAASQHHQPGSGDRVCGRPGAPHGQGRRRDLVWRRQARRRPDPAQIAGPLAPARRTRPPLGSGAASFRSPRHAPEQGHDGGPAGTGRGGVFRPATGVGDAGAGAVQRDGPGPGHRVRRHAPRSYRPRRGTAMVWRWAAGRRADPAAAAPPLGPGTQQCSGTRRGVPVH
jgi:hypothetical protein